MKNWLRRRHLVWLVLAASAVALVMLLASAGAAAKQPVIVAASATPATALAPSHITESSKPGFAETVGRFVDARVLLIAGLVLAAAHFA